MSAMESCPEPFAASLGDDCNDTAADWALPLPDGTQWVSWHTWQNNETGWVDGRIVNTYGNTIRQLDIGAVGDDCCVSELDALAATVEWSNGRVHVLPASSAGTCQTLVLPTDAVTTALMYEALQRAAQHRLLGDN